MIKADLAGRPRVNERSALRLCYSMRRADQHAPDGPFCLCHARATTFCAASNSANERSTNSSPVTGLAPCRQNPFAKPSAPMLLVALAFPARQLARSKSRFFLFR